MQIHDKTNAPTFYSISTPGMADCGTIDPGGSVDLPAYDNERTVTVAFSFPDGSPSIEAPGNGQVTIEVKKRP